MSRQQALIFISKVREDPDIRNSIVNSQGELTPDELIGIGSKLSLEFDVDDLNQAFRHEWAIRWMHYRTGRVK